MKTAQIYFLYLLFVLPIATFGFTFSVATSSETCVGNGSITITPINVDSNGSILYYLYKLPNIVVPIAITPNTVLNGLTFGTYKIVAKETVNGVVTSQEQDTTIANNTSILSYSILNLNQACVSTSTITINTITGNAVNYEIFSGPILYPLQTSNIFSGLTVGNYKVRVFDSCGNGIVQTFTVTQNQAGLTIAPPSFTNTNPVDCNFTIANNTVTPASGTVIGYPLIVNYIVHPPTGADIIFNQNVTNGNLTSQSIVQTIPYYLNQNYSYDITITDVCGTVITQNFIISNNITLVSTIVVLDCDKYYFTLTAANFSPPYTLNFLSAPTGFNPTSFNASYPGPFSINTINFGSDINPAPIGIYTVQITDSCGRTLSTPKTFSITSIPVFPTATGSTLGCLNNDGKIEIIMSGSNLTSVILTNAPPNYSFPLPQNLSGNIDIDGNFILNQLITGTYTLLLTDSCSSSLQPLDVIVPIYQDQGISTDVREGCSNLKGSVKISSNNGALTSVIVTVAPSSFSTSLPLNVSNNIVLTSGVFYLGNLPPGSYTFKTIDSCNFSSTKTITIQGYSITTESFSLQPNCGSFTIPLNVISNAGSGQKFWLQKLINQATNTWGNPETDNLYIEGSIPTPNNSYLLTNNSINLNISINGTFRIIKYFSSYNSGSDLNSGLLTDANTICLETLAPTLSFNQSLEILDVNRLPCTTSGNLDVFINAIGSQPLHYKIISKNGLPFVLDNSTSNIFYNLPQALYQFVIEDACGNIAPKTYDITTLTSFIKTTQPQDIKQCKTVITGNELFNLTQQNPIILGNQAASDYTITYFNSLFDAQNNVNPILNTTTFNPTTNPQEVFARVIFNPLPNCYETISFNLFVGIEPKLNLNQNYLNCIASPQVLDASSGNLSSTTYSWLNTDTNSVVSTNATISISQLGVTNLVVTATNDYGNLKSCTKSLTVEIINSLPPVLDHIETSDWTNNENSISIFTTNTGAFQYSIDQINYQDNPVFTNLSSGLYTVFIKDKAGCDEIQQDVWLLNYPYYFTPNNDGYHDFWYVKNSNFEPDFKVTIFDRYGKLITTFNSNSQGWDGNYNGNKLLSDDYWFVIYRQDGRIHKGHFAMKR